MLSLSKLLTRNFNLTVSGMRSIYSADYLGLDVFQKHCKYTQEKSFSQLDAMKKNMSASLSKSDGKIFLDDLKTVLYCSKTDDDINLVINSIERYNKQEKLEQFTFNVPLAKLLYSLNKTDMALEILSKHPDLFRNSPKVAMILMSKLITEKRYDDVITVYNAAFNKIDETTKISSVLILLSHALVEKK